MEARAGGKLARLFPQPAREGWADRRDCHRGRETLQQLVLLLGLWEVAVWELVSSCCSVCSLTIMNLRVDKAHFRDKQNPPIKSLVCLQYQHAAGWLLEIPKHPILSLSLRCTHFTGAEVKV